MSDGHIYLISFGGHAARASSFLISYLPLSLPSHPQGAVDKIVLPEGMQTVNFERCYGLTGTAERMMVVII
jgi:hypothetical protein